MLRLFQGPPDISLHRAPKKLDTALSICPNKLLGLVWTSLSLHVVALGWTMIEDLTPITETLPSEVLFIQYFSSQYQQTYWLKLL